MYFSFNVFCFICVAKFCIFVSKIRCIITYKYIFSLIDNGEVNMHFVKPEDQYVASDN